jgi:hypothetical protein
MLLLLGVEADLAGRAALAVALDPVLRAFAGRLGPGVGGAQGERSDKRCTALAQGIPARHPLRQPAGDRVECPLCRLFARGHGLNVSANPDRTKAISTNVHNSSRANVHEER